LNAAHSSLYWNRLQGARRVLDLGCGDGAIGALKPAGCEVNGLEISPRLVDGLVGYAGGAVWDLDNDKLLPFSDGYFDAVAAKGILEHVRRP